MRTGHIPGTTRPASIMAVRREFPMPAYAWIRRTAIPRNMSRQLMQHRYAVIRIGACPGEKNCVRLWITASPITIPVPPLTQVTFQTQKAAGMGTGIGRPPRMPVRILSRGVSTSALATMAPPTRTVAALFVLFAADSDLRRQAMKICRSVARTVHDKGSMHERTTGL